MKKAIFLLMLVSLLTACGQQGAPIIQISEKAHEKASQEMTTEKEAIAEAKKIYEMHVTEGTDFSRGPCLSNRLIPNWVLDIAHEPRIAEDEDANNQCSAYNEGLAEHFVELNEEGKLIRAE